MSDATRAVAVSEAVKTFGGQQVASADVLRVAKQFDDFLNATGETADAKVSTPGKEPPKRVVGKGPPKGGGKPAKSEEEVVKDALEAQRLADEAEDAAGDEPEPEAEPDVEIKFDKDGVQAAVAKMLEANKRKEAIALLKKYGAASAGGVKPKDFKAFITTALKTAGETSEESDDLTA